MSAFFLDTSALAKRYITEKGSFWMMAQCHFSAGNILIISQATLVEAVAVFCRKTRESSSALRITPEERDKLIAVFRQDVRDEYELVNVTKTIYKRAGDLCRVHQLRAYDAIQLACALFANKRLTSSGQPAPIFVSADDRLLDIARAEGFGVENPNNYP